MTSSIVYNRPRENSNAESLVFAFFPNDTNFSVEKVVTYDPKGNSPMKISFAPGTQFDDRSRSKVAEKVKKTKYTIKPVCQKTHPPLLYKAPASTMPSTPMMSTTQRDFQAPSEKSRRAMNPPPKWFYRTSTDLLVSKSGLDYKGNSQVGQSSNVIQGADDSKPDISLLPARDGFRSSKSLYIPEQPRRRDKDDTLLTWYLKEGINPASNISQCKPLIGDFESRQIEKARLQRAVKLSEYADDAQMIQQVTQRKFEKPVRRSTSFTSSQTPFRIYKPPSYENNKPTLKVERNAQGLSRQKSRSLTSVTAIDNNSLPANPAQIRKEKTSVEMFSNSMQRTYEKQQMLKDLIKK